MRLECVVVGAGAAGLAVSRELTAAGVEHAVLERGSVADTWRNQRWDSFRLNTPGWMNATVGDVEPDSFQFRDEIVDLLTAQARSCPVREHTAVTSISHDGRRFAVVTEDERLDADAVVLASGMRNVAKRPAASTFELPGTLQLHTSDYRSAADLPTGAVLVIGGAQSGCQIAEDLAVAGRRVFLATSRVGRYSWRYRGSELFRWLTACGFWDARPEDVGAEAVRSPFGVVASGGRDLDLRILAEMGVTLLGRFAGADAGRVRVVGSVAAHAAYADASAAELEAMADDYIARAGIDAPEAVRGTRQLQPPRLQPPAAEPFAVADGAGELDLAAEGVSTVVWATGFTGDLSWVHLPVQDASGEVLHDRCASRVPGLWFVGFPWLTRRRSGIFFGVPDDAAEVSDAVVDHLTVRSSRP